MFLLFKCIVAFKENSIFKLTKYRHFIKIFLWWIPIYLLVDSGNPLWIWGLIPKNYQFSFFPIKRASYLFSSSFSDITSWDIQGFNFPHPQLSMYPKKKKVIKSLNFYDAHLVNGIYKMTNSINVASLVLSYLSFLLSQKVLDC